MKTLAFIIIIAIIVFGILFFAEIKDFVTKQMPKTAQNITYPLNSTNKTNSLIDLTKNTS